MALSPRTLRPSSNWTPKSISGLAMWLDASDSQSLYTTDAGAVTAVSAPTEIAGCVGWWDASDAASITQSGGSVSQINDKSGLAAHASQGTSGSRPTLIDNALNGRSILRFDGGDGLTGNFASSINTGAYSVFAVCKVTSMVTNGRVFSVAGASSDFASGMMIPCCTNASSVSQLSAYDGASGANKGAVDGFTSYAVFSGVVGTSSLTNAANGMRAASASVTLNTAVTRFGIGTPAQGGAGGWNGDIAEVIYYSAALSNADRARVEAYLAAKWGISGVHAPATATSDPVGAWLDKSGNARHATQSTAGNRPTISATNQNGRNALAFDGANGWMRTERTTYAARSVFTVFRRTGTAAVYSSPLSKQSNVAAGYGGSSYAVAYGNEGGWSIVGSGTGRMNYSSNGSPHKLSAAHMRGAAMPLADAQNYLTGIVAAPNTTDAELLYAEAATDTDGNQAWFLGTEPFATTRKYPANILEVLIYNRAITATERLRIERYLAARWGITLAPQVSNADAQDWINRVYANGGTVSSSTAASVSAFCDSIDSVSGLRACFYRLNLFCGSNLNAALVPLYRSASFGGSPLGNTTDTNNAFVVTDYSEASGLGPQATSSTTKYLDTGFAGTSFGATRHVGVFIPAPGYTASNSHSYLGSSGAGSVNHIGMFIQDNGIRAIDSAGGSYNGVSVTDFLTAGHYVGNTPSGSFTLRRTWRNGVAIGSGGDATATATASTMYVFAENRNGTVSRRTANGMYGYHFGLDMTSAQAESLRSAFNTFATAIGRPNV